jgi:hypothetical protein
MLKLEGAFYEYAKAPKNDICIKTLRNVVTVIKGNHKIWSNLTVHKNKTDLYNVDLQCIIHWLLRRHRAKLRIEPSMILPVSSLTIFSGCVGLSLNFCGIIKSTLHVQYITVLFAT